MIQYTPLALSKVEDDVFDQPSQALVSVIMQAPNLDKSLANAWHKASVNTTATVMSGHID